MLDKEFDRQVENLLQKGYPDLAGAEAVELVQSLEPLKGQALALDLPKAGIDESYIPFVIVVKRDLLPVDRLMPLVTLRGKSGFSVMDAQEIERFKPVANVALPEGVAYLLVDIDTGKETLNVTPNDALKILEEQGRSPLTIEEGVALVTHFPESLKKNNCFSLLASRCGDKRVTALWISEGRPKLGWCWAGNPHTWLGSASCGARIGA